MIILPGNQPKTPYPDLAMKCDYVMGVVQQCKYPPMRAPRLVVPSMTPEVAECVCGWTSGPRFSGMIASVALREHYTKEAGRDYDKDNSDAAMVDRISKEPDA